MTIETFFEKFDQFANTPNAVAKMRELILRLAMQGKLVPQDPHGELADGLLIKIKAEVDKHGRRTSQLPPITPDEIPFDLPVGWAWERLGNIGETNIGLTYSPQDVSDVGTPVLRSSNVQNGKLDFVDLVRVSCVPKQSVMVQDGDLLICARNGSRALVGKVAIIEDLKEPAAFGAFMAIFRSRVNRFLYHFISSPLFRRMIDEVSTTTINQITQNNLRSTLAPIPPLAEQKRIVAKVDELMALCDQLEAQQQERETRHAALARASLARFADAPTPANLNFLFHKSYTIPPADLRKSILTLAVQGKLVPQNPNDEPAEELIARILKCRLTTKSKVFGVVGENEAPYEIPFSWSWVRLGSISLSSDSGWSPQCMPESRSGTQWGVLKVSAVSWGVFKPEENKALPPGMAARPDCEVKSGDFLLSRANTEDLVARSVVVDKTPPRLMMSDKIVRFTFPNEIEKAFISLANASDPARAYYARNASGTSSSMKNIGREVMCNLPIPLPPLAEQKRIVAKVDQLMALVDQLETQLATSRTTAGNLMSAIVSELTQPA
jgi:type I restriction enzyme S subunit